jgi:hypothetical protein
MQAEEEMWDHPERVNALKRLVWERGYPVEYSNYAVDQLIAIDEAMARKYLAATITVIKDERTLQYVVDKAVERQWMDFVPALVRSYSLPTNVFKDEERPERKAIEALIRDKPVEQVIVDVFASNPGADIKQRVAAWSLLHRIFQDQGRVIDMLNAAPAGDPLVADLKAGAAELGVVPDSMETVTWLRVLRSDPAWWTRAKATVARLSPEQRVGLQLRHLGPLVYLHEIQPDVLGQSRQELISEMTQWVDRQDHFLKGPTYDGPMDGHPQTFRHWRDDLTWGDLATIKAMTGLLQNKRLISAWFTHGVEDRHDKSTEYGGLVRRDEKGEPYVHAYPPLARRHDLKYLPPKELVTDGYKALAHYHFHAQEFSNARFAGPGIGDMQRIARTQRFTGLVLTFIDEERLNVDLYHAPDVVIDLGTIRR